MLSAVESGLVEGQSFLAVVDEPGLAGRFSAFDGIYCAVLLGGEGFVVSDSVFGGILP